MKWISALKEWNSKTNKGKWCIPRKGSSEYDDVKKIMTGNKDAPESSYNEKLAYSKFRLKEFKPYKKQFPDLDNKQVFDILEKLWKTYTPTEKKKYM
jgi:hypothetical protein